MNNLWKKIASGMLLAALLPAATGCSEVFENRCIDKITYESECLIVDMQKDREKAIKLYSDEEVEIPTISEVGIEYVDEYFKNFSSNCTIGFIDLEYDRQSAVVEFILEDAFVTKKDTSYVGPEEDVRKLIESSRKDVSVELNMSRIDNQWVFDDLSPLVEAIYNPYENVVFMGSEGLPVDVNQDYLDAFSRDNIVDVMWYNPISGNPMSENNIKNTRYLKCVFYFTMPQTLELVATLYQDNKEVMTKDIIVNNSSVAECDFGYDQEETTFESGTYKVVLSYNGMTLATSSDISVR